MLLEFLTVGVGGFIGSCARYALTKATNPLHLQLPLGTLLSNVIAGLLIGVIIGIEQQSVSISPKAKLFLTTGLLGGLSTFSTFSIETVTLFQTGKYPLAAANILLNLILSLLGTLTGLYIAKILLYRP